MTMVYFTGFDSFEASLSEDTVPSARGPLIAEFIGHGYLVRLGRMAVLPVAAFRCDELPAVALDGTHGFADLGHRVGEATGDGPCRRRLLRRSRGRPPRSVFRPTSRGSGRQGGQGDPDQAGGRGQGAERPGKAAAGAAGRPFGGRGALVEAHVSVHARSNGSAAQTAAGRCCASQGGCADGRESQGQQLPDEGLPGLAPERPPATPRVARIVTIWFIPACAGNGLTMDMAPPGQPLHPRVCGERSRPNSNSNRSFGSSPRVRGTDRPSVGEDDRRRFIPACAGNGRPSISLQRRLTVHPRVCGERLMTAGRWTSPDGSSPRVRGTGSPPRREGSIPRFIPACAGNGPGRDLDGRGHTVHPRVCGERHKGNAAGHQ